MKCTPNVRFLSKIWGALQNLLDRIEILMENELNINTRE